MQKSCSYWKVWWFHLKVMSLILLSRWETQYSANDVVLLTLKSLQFVENAMPFWKETAFLSRLNKQDTINVTLFELSLFDKREFHYSLFFVYSCTNAKEKKLETKMFLWIIKSSQNEEGLTQRINTLAYLMEHSSFSTHGILVLPIEFLLS